MACHVRSYDRLGLASWICGSDGEAVLERCGQSDNIDGRIKLMGTKGQGVLWCGLWIKPIGQSWMVRMMASFPSVGGMTF